MRHVAELENISLEELYTKVGWPLARKYGHIYDAFRLAIVYLFLFSFFFSILFFKY